MPAEIYANDASTTVTTGGTGTPGTETWTVASSAGFPAASSSAALPTQFHVADPALPSELMTITNVSGTTWSVTRGAEGTTAVAHAAGFTVREVVSAGGLAQLRIPDWINAATMFGADPTGVADSTAAINGAITAANGAGLVYLPAGTYKLTSALSIGSGVTLAGDGPAATILNQTSTTANAITITGTTVLNVSVRDLRLNGPNSGSGAGIAAAANAGANPVVQLVLRNLIVYQFGSHGLYLQNTIVSLLDNIQSVNNLGRGFYLFNGTSTTLLNCYANYNTSERGFYLSSLLYSSLLSCAADGNAIGYELYQCDNVGLVNCGAEVTAAAGGLDGSSYKINACTSTSLRGGRALQNAAAGAYFTGSSVHCSLDGFTETVTGSPTASIKIDAGCSVSVANYVIVTGVSYASGTVTILTNNGYSYFPSIEVGTAAVLDSGFTSTGAGSMGGSQINLLGNGALYTDAAALGQMPGSPAPADIGLIAWSMDPMIAVGSYLPTAAGSVYGTALWVRSNVTVSKLVIQITVIGATLTANECWGLLYNSSGTLIGKTADQHTAWAATGNLAMTLTAVTSLALTPGMYWGAVVASGTTLPTFKATSSGTGSATANFGTGGQLSAATSRFGILATGVTTAPGNITPSAIAQTPSQPLLIGLY